MYVCMYDVSLNGLEVITNCSLRVILPVGPDSESVTPTFSLRMVTDPVPEIQCCTDF